MLVTANEAFDNHAAAFLQCQLVSGFDFGARIQIGEYAAAVISVRRLDDHRQTDIFGRFPGFGGAFDYLSFRDRHTAGLQQGFGQVFVARDTFGDGAGLIGFCGPDTALANAMAELDQIAFSQAE